MCTWHITSASDVNINRYSRLNKHSMTYCSYNIQERTKNGIGLGALVYEMMLCNHYCKMNNLTLVLAVEGYESRWLDGSVNGDVRMYYHDLFSEPSLLMPNIELKWPDEVPNVHYNICTTNKYEWFSNRMKEIFVLSPKCQEEVDKKIERSGFNSATDLVLHIRRTDKVKWRQNSIPESGEMPLLEYVEPTAKIAKEHNLRVFLCTDDMEIVEECGRLFNQDSVAMTYDGSQDKRERQSLRMARKLTSDEIIDENYTATSIMVMMSRARYLIGGRMSCLFRVGELLRYPLPTLNLKDNDRFGKAEYALPEEPIVRPMMIRRYRNFINKYYSLTQIKDVMIVRHFLDYEHVSDIKRKISEFQWWARTETHHSATGGTHYSSCDCFMCKIDETCTCNEMVDFVTKLGVKINKVLSRTAIKYTKGDHRKLESKSSKVLILDLTDRWNVEDGGLTHFVSDGEVTTIVPHFGNLIIANNSYLVSTVVNDVSRVEYVVEFE